MARWEPDAAGRLMVAALELFDKQGYEATTVSEVAAAAGLTRRTYFRHFADKREVLFSGSEETQGAWVAAVRDAPRAATAMSAVEAGFDSLAARFDGLHDAARRRARIIEANRELQERELIKLEELTHALADALRGRRVDSLNAQLAARAGTTIFHVGFTTWVAQDDPTVLRRLMSNAARRLRRVVQAE